MSKIVIFDFDGTLADSMQLMIESYNQAAHMYGCTYVQPEEIEQLRSMHLRDILYLLKIPYLKLPFLLYSALSYYKTKLSTINIFSGIIDMLSGLKLLGYDLYIVSTNNVDTIEHFLKERDLPMFKGVYSCGSNMFGKGAVIKKILEREQILPTQAFYVGDELRDIEAGHQIGMRVIAVSWGYNSREKLAGFKADVVIDIPAELIKYVQTRDNAD